MSRASSPSCGRVRTAGGSGGHGADSEAEQGGEQRGVAVMTCGEAWWNVTVSPRISSEATLQYSVRVAPSGGQSVVGVLAILVLPGQHPAGDQRQHAPEHEDEQHRPPGVASFARLLSVHTVTIAGQSVAPRGGSTSNPTRSAR